MPDPRTSIIIVVALSGLVLPAAFLLVLVGASLRRRAGHEPGAAWNGSIAFFGGASLGTMFLIADDLLIGAPLALAVVGIAVSQWRSGRRPLAAWLVLGAAVPWTLLSMSYMVLYSRGLLELDPLETVVAFLAGAVLCALSVLVIARRPTEASGGQASGPGSWLGAGAEPGPEPASASETAPDTVTARAGARRVPRSFQTVGSAIREPSRLGPFGLPEVAALVALVAFGLALIALGIFGLPPIAGYALAIVVGSALATEAYLRAMATRTRRSMEAFMWLGSWDLAQVRAATGGGVPTSRGGAAKWLVSHPESPGEGAAVGSLRVELSLLAGRAADAQTLVERLPEATPLERFHKAASADVVAWWTSRGDALEAMARAEDGIEPPEGDDRLRAEVALAVARVRHLAVADPPVANPLTPLLEVRDRLGSRADGLVRRILWPRLYRVFVLASIVFAVAGAATGLSAPPI
ncbi:MAG TPA: hypothetical protein VJ506_04110, partial [Candidatus Limnocylindrales bacterium]|nr:hypothetical protein [Candidatus Limnocylindrales bacterium]